MESKKVKEVKSKKVVKSTAVKKAVVKKAAVKKVAVKKTVTKKTVEVKSNRKTLSGKVISAKMNKTVRVSVESKMSHPVYSKVITKNKTYFAHTDKELKEGDKVTIRESRPYSKNITWVVV